MIKNVTKQVVTVENGKWFTTLDIKTSSCQELTVDIVDELDSEKQSILSIENFKRVDVEEILKELQQSSFDYDEKDMIQKLKNLDQVTFSYKNVEFKKDDVDTFLELFGTTKNLKKRYDVFVDGITFKIRLEDEKITEISYLKKLNIGGKEIDDYVEMTELFSFQKQLETYMKNTLRIRDVVNYRK